MLKTLKKNSDRQYDTAQDRKIITTTEQYAARKHGEISCNEVTRKDHVKNDPPFDLPDFSSMSQRKILDYVTSSNQVKGATVTN